MSTIKLGIADDHSLFREGIRMIVSGMTNIEVCLEAGNGIELLEKLEQAPVDIVLMDIEMNGMNGIDCLKKLSKQPSKPKVIVLSMHNEPQIIRHMIELGASGYLPKDVKKDELETAIRTVFEKGSYLNELTSQILMSALQTKQSKHPLLTQLTAREKEVLNLICQELTAQQIGEKLFISERTVEGHRSNLFLKLDVKNTAGLVKKAYQMKLVD